MMSAKSVPSAITSYTLRVMFRMSRNDIVPSALRIEYRPQSRMCDECESRRQVDGGGRLSDPAFLIRQRNYHEMMPVTILQLAEFVGIEPQALLQTLGVKPACYVKASSRCR